MIRVATKVGVELLRDPALNNPDVIETEDLQLQRVNAQLAQKPTDLERYVYLMNLLDHNETLFYPIIVSYPARFPPIVYDPTIGEACLRAGVRDTARVGTRRRLARTV